MRVGAHRKSASPHHKRVPRRLPTLNVGAALSRRIGSGIKNVEGKRERQLKFTMRSGFISPRGNALQLVYLNSRSSRTGLNITYIDARAKEFWAQGPGVSGRVVGPFALPDGVSPALAKLTARERAEAAQEEKRSRTQPDTSHSDTTRRDDTPSFGGGSDWGAGGGGGGAGGGGGGS